MYSTSDAQFDLSMAFRGDKYRYSFKAWLIYNQLRVSSEILPEFTADPINRPYKYFFSVFCRIEALE